MDPLNLPAHPPQMIQVISKGLKGKSLLINTKEALGMFGLLCRV